MNDRKYSVKLLSSHESDDYSALPYLDKMYTAWGIEKDLEESIRTSSDTPRR